MYQKPKPNTVEKLLKMIWKDLSQLARLSEVYKATESMYG